MFLKYYILYKTKYKNYEKYEKPFLRYDMKIFYFLYEKKFCKLFK